ncbi:MAG: zinc-binding dehydrogenase [Chloroflexi bacterium]|nr:zinc-binding dehydrogenase [Chloroflexota bacterium]
MKAVRIHKPGGLEELKYEDAPDPVPGPGEALVRVRACALNHLDLNRRATGFSGAFKQPHILGSDIAGEVVALGEGVSGVKVGDPVVVAPGMGCGRCADCLAGNENLCMGYRIVGAFPGIDGGYAELVKVPAASLLPKPARLSYEEAGSLPVTFLTAWHMVMARGALKPGETVLIHAVGAGVGIASLQIAKLVGATAIVTAGSDEKLAKARALGADHTVNYKTADFVQEVRRITDKRGVDMVVDTVGLGVLEKSLPLVVGGGRVVACGGTAGRQVPLDLAPLYYRSVSIIGSNMGSRSELMHLLGLFQAGKLKPVVHKTLPLREAPEAHRILEERQNFGKVVLVP